ncbi:ATP-dependent DNA helicase [Ramlibacter pallidus]|uniref:ATP-dependent DNA helicase n=1 Tax=Ramlibacter pallidus TaxID=2780087 RepID=A0ABR9S2J3_9BURK|nr:ATP-dependent DNA helicase [Ramlibacter pallidus]MBE7367522.1 ATP-dependent DNA helicase [Ramlibacter pallidus]
MQYTVSVRALCDFTARRGDLDLRFTPTPSAQEGIAGHQLVTSRRGPEYETEITLRGEFGPLVVRGRADGYDPVANRLEEIKTHRGDLAKQPGNHRHLHWTQAKVYGHLLCRERGLEEIEVALVYFDIASQEETEFMERHSAESLRVFFEERCGEFLAWAEQEMEHRRSRDEQLTALTFPHAEFRKGQRQLAEAVYKGAASGRCVLAQAPTGIGKTIGTLFSMLKAAAPHKLDKVFYLTAKTTGRQLALDAARQITESAPDLRLRVLELTARDKACEHPDKACHGDSCPLARGFYDRLPSARSEAVQAGCGHAGALRSIARQHQVCPYYLAQELARWADVIVGDYNYWFDGSAMLYGATLANEWKVGVLADEAHNLVERGRVMYSGTLQQGALRAARSKAPGIVRRALDKVDRALSAVGEEHPGEDAPEELSPNFINTLKQACVVMETHFAESAPGAADAALQQFYFDVLGFVRLAEEFGSHSVLELTEQAGASAPAIALRIQNLIPAPFLKPRFAAARTVTLFSATLTPPQYQIDMLGLPAETAWIDVESPFSAEQLHVRIVDRISTRYGDRQRSAAPIGRLIAEQFAAQRGNYLAFFSSFEYLDLVAGEFQREYPQVPAWVQARGMAEAERNNFLARFVPGSAGVGFAVLGGAFGEGIDLKGDRLVGAFVATLGLPQVNARNELLRERLEEAFGSGYDYAYLFPGMQKVVQAAGRVIRTTEDRGVVHLIDDRFGRMAVQGLLPQWWAVGSHRLPGA